MLHVPVQHSAWQCTSKASTTLSLTSTLFVPFSCNPSSDTIQTPHPLPHQRVATIAPPIPIEGHVETPLPLYIRINKAHPIGRASLHRCRIKAMQAGRNAAASVKEAAGNAAASAKAGMEKTKATAQEKVDKMSANNPVEKELARGKKEGKIAEAEVNKQSTRTENAAAKEATRAGIGGGHTAITHP